MDSWLRRTLAFPILAALVATLALTAVPAAGLANAIVDDDNPTLGWRPGNGLTYAMARVGNMIVLGGTFTYMRSPDGATTVTRNRLAAVDATTGALLPWNPAANGDVYTVAGSPDGSTVYVGGAFTSVAGISRSRAAALSATTGQATSFVANLSAGLVRNIKFIDGGVFIVGDFGRINGVNRAHGAEVHPTTGAVRAWNPRTDRGINVVTPAGDGSGVFIGGWFTTANGQARDFVAKTDRANGSVLPWLSGSTCQDAGNPCYVFEIHATADTVYLGQGGPGGRVVSLDPNTGTQRWWSGTDGDVTSVQYNNGKLYVGGHFDVSFNGAPRAGIAVLSSATGAVLPDFNVPVLGGAGVWQLMIDGDILRACGQFSTVGGKSIGRYTTFKILPDPPDTQAPNRPGTFRVPAALSDNVSMSWAAAADDVATVQYRIYRDGVQIGASNTLNYKDRSVSPGTRYTYTVAAVDAAGNVSPQATPVTVTTETARSTLLQRGAVWSFLSFGNPPATGWNTNLNFSESGWGTGTGEFGYGDADEDTPISPRGVAHYFRTTFNVADATTVESARMRLLVDDGAVVYLNGQEVTRVNMPTGTITNTSLASTGIGGTGEMTYATLNIPVGMLQNGANLLAVSVHNQSTGSNDISFDAFVEYTPKPGTIPAPNAPANLRATDVSGAAVSLAWDAALNATSYVVYRNGNQIATPGGTTFTDSNVNPQTTYTYTVRAVNATGPSPQSAPLEVTTPPVPAPAAPANLRTTDVTGVRVSLAWDAVADAASYEVYRNGNRIATPTGTTFSDADVIPETTYTYTVRAVNAGGPSPDSAPLEVTTPAVPAPAAPANLRTTTVSSGAVGLAWDAVADAASYEVYRNGNRIATPTGTTFSDANVNQATTYTYTVRAVNVGGTSPDSSPLEVTTPTGPILSYVLAGAGWRILDGGAQAPASWADREFDDAAWKTGTTEMGYGDGDEATVLNWGTGTGKAITYYARTSFEAGADISDVTSLALRAVVDDGAVVYLNGQEIWRFNLPSGPITSTTRASTYIAGAGESTWRTASLPAGALRPGNNVIAVEVHQDAPSSSDLSLNLELRPVR